MALVLPDGFGLAKVNWIVAGQNDGAVTVVGYDNNGTDADTAAGNLRSFFANSFLPFMASSAILDTVDTVQRDGAVYSAGTTPALGGTFGEVTTGSCPSNTTWLVKKKTNVMGRRNQGRMYIPGVPEASIDSSGALDPDVQVSIQIELNTAYAALIILNQIVILHRDPLVPDNYDDLPPTPVSQMLIDTRVATQRRRLR